jgi:Tol biopolymer transport system component
VLALAIGLVTGCSERGRDIVKPSIDHGQAQWLKSSGYALCWHPDGEWVVYSSSRHGNWELYAHNLTSGQDVRLTESPAWDSRPTISPDGRWLAWVSDGDGDYDILLMLLGLEELEGGTEVAGGPARRITENDVDDGGPCWHPDGRGIAYSSGRYGGGGPLYYQDVDEQAVPTGPPRLIAPQTTDLPSPVFSPDGRSLAFTGPLSPADGYSIWIAREHTSAPTVLADVSEWDVQPAWAPDGQRLFFRAGGDERGCFATGLDGGNASRITPEDADVHSFDVSPHGSELVYAASRPGLQGMHLWSCSTAPDADAAAEPQEPLGEGYAPQFSPDGSMIAYFTERGRHLWVMNRDGSGVRLLVPDLFWLPE